MADRTDKVPGNVPGRYYVDRSCVPCNLCLDEAPALMKASDDGDFAMFVRQPETPADEAQARAALEICPSEAIGDDGDR